MTRPNGIYTTLEDVSAALKILVPLRRRLSFGQRDHLDRQQSDSTARDTPNSESTKGISAWRHAVALRDEAGHPPSRLNRTLKMLKMLLVWSINKLARFDFPDERKDCLWSGGWRVFSHLQEAHAGTPESVRVLWQGKVNYGTFSRTQMVPLQMLDNIELRVRSRKVSFLPLSPSLFSSCQIQNEGGDEPLSCQTFPNLSTYKT